ncbi:CDP-glycerol glycerophosphotransferase family protein [Lederbergia wuyishanensis]|uniref:CDP-ribitol ribitolphosphotransferase n=1 Tax=Lederbergia wuyishanensis TaxID=1347903 RepID=A0ABU0D385_9BACI|nr:CDP-glycerol glycerophosphotransferase family protein [Lederbergia wuyishanensis]MCJ8007969.1 CDP-glycerol glycerophosphotransferase family protein [Lederbergia wuyishanensis]MDQ0342861.1 CDP-ribitol ribitolphosphotransferase [Lederbergia wuyishanensis]
MDTKLIPTLLVKGVINLAYNICRFLFPINEKKVTFASYRSTGLEGNLLFLYKAMKSEYKGYHYKFLIKKFNGSTLGKANYFIHMLKASYALATSRYFIIDDYYFPIYVVKPRNGTEVIQLWHAAGAFKKFGLSTMNKSFGPKSEYLNHVKIHSNYSRVYVSSSSVKSYYAEAFGMPKESIYPLGLPRTDFFFNHLEKEKAFNKFHQEFPELKNKKVILYAPTFRGSSHRQTEFNCPIDLTLLRKIIGDNFVLLINLHPYMKKNSKYDEKEKQFAYYIDNELNIEELLAISDILITDYSSVIFDYSLLLKPIAFFATDLDEYIKERDFYFDYKSFIPGPLFTDTESLSNWIIQSNYDLGSIENFRNLFFDYVDGNASKRIAEHLLAENDHKVQIGD